jgi:hypothetical protein
MQRDAKRNANGNQTACNGHPVARKTPIFTNGDKRHIESRIAVYIAFAFYFNGKQCAKYVTLLLQ